MKDKNENKAFEMPSAEDVAQELGKATSIDDFYGKDGIFSRLFSKTIEQMLEAELSAELGYERYESAGRNSGNNRNGHYKRKMRTSGGDAEIKVPRDRNGEFQSALLQKNSNEIEQKILAMYAKGMSTRDIQEMLEELYGIDVSPETISAITDKVWPLVEEWQNRPLMSQYAIVYLDAIHIKLRREKARSSLSPSTTSWALIWTDTRKFWGTGSVTAARALISGSRWLQTYRLVVWKIFSSLP
jgi:transposase-like protein